MELNYVWSGSVGPAIDHVLGNPVYSGSTTQSWIRYCLHRGLVTEERDRDEYGWYMFHQKQFFELIIVRSLRDMDVSYEEIVKILDGFEFEGKKKVKVFTREFETTKTALGDVVATKCYTIHYKAAMRAAEMALKVANVLQFGEAKPGDREGINKLLVAG